MREPKPKPKVLRNGAVAKPGTVEPPEWKGGQGTSLAGCRKICGTVPAPQPGNPSRAKSAPTEVAQAGPVPGMANPLWERNEPGKPRPA